MNTIAQEKKFATQTLKVNAKNNVLQNYIEISSLPINERKSFFSSISATDKADIFKLHLALQFVKRPNLTDEQKELILETIPTLSSESYKKNNSQIVEKVQQEAMMLQQKARIVFSKQEGFEIFASLGGDTTDIDMLQSYQYISDFDMTARKYIFGKALAKDKSNLWKVHLALYLAKHSELTKEQKKIILEGITLFTPELYKIPVKSWSGEIETDNEAIQLFTKRAQEVFSKEKGAEVFEKLGGAESQYSRNLDEIESSMLRADNCGCSRASDWCWETCIGVGCKQTTWGCGTGWSYPCDHNGCS